MENLLVSQEVLLIESCLGDYIGDFKVRMFEHTNVVVVYNRRDAVNALAVLQGLNYTAIEVDSPEREIEIIFN